MDMDYYVAKLYSCKNKDEEINNIVETLKKINHQVETENLSLFDKNIFGIILDMDKENFKIKVTESTKELFDILCKLNLNPVIITRSKFINIIDKIILCENKFIYEIQFLNKIDKNENNRIKNLLISKDNSVSFSIKNMLKEYDNFIKSISWIEIKDDYIFDKTLSDSGLFIVKKDKKS